MKLRAARSVRRKVAHLESITAHEVSERIASTTSTDLVTGDAVRTSSMADDGTAAVS